MRSEAELERWCTVVISERRKAICSNQTWSPHAAWIAIFVRRPWSRMILVRDATGRMTTSLSFVKVLCNHSLPEAEGKRIQVLWWMSGLSLWGCDGEGEPLYVKISTQGISTWESTDDQKRRDGRFFGVWAAAVDMSELWKAVFGSRQELSALWEKCAWHRCLDRFWCCWHFLMMIELGWNTAETEICSGWQVFLL